MTLRATRLTIGTPPRGCDLMDEEPLAPLFDLAWLEQALHRRSRSDFSNKAVGFEADSAAIFSSARERISRAIFAKCRQERGAVLTMFEETPRKA